MLQHRVASRSHNAPLNHPSHCHNRSNQKKDDRQLTSPHLQHGNRPVPSALHPSSYEDMKRSNAGPTHDLSLDFSIIARERCFRSISFCALISTGGTFSRSCENLLFSCSPLSTIVGRKAAGRPRHTIWRLSRRARPRGRSESGLDGRTLKSSGLS